jgi:hypothetical protein
VEIRGAKQPEKSWLVGWIREVENAWEHVGQRRSHEFLELRFGWVDVKPGDECVPNGSLYAGFRMDYRSVKVK